MKRIQTWLGCTVLVLGMAAIPSMAADQPDLSGPPVTQERNGPGGQQGRQFNGERAHRPGDRLQEVLGQLNLTDEQKTKIREILKADAGTMADSRKEMKTALEELRAAMQSKDQDKIKAAHEKLKTLRDAAKDKLVSQISPVLTDEQKSKLQELLKQRAEERGGPEGRRGGPLEALQQDIAKLNLTDDQKTQVQSIIKTHREAMEKFMAENKDKIQALRQKMQDAMQSKDREAAQAAHEEMRKLMESAPVKPKDLIDQLSKVLTEEQSAQLKKMIQEHRGNRGPGGPGGDEMGGRRRGPGGPGGDGNNPPPPPPGGEQLDL